VSVRSWASERMQESFKERVVNLINIIKDLIKIRILKKTAAFN
jgi:hypothetical protein